MSVHYRDIAKTIASSIVALLGKRSGEWEHSFFFRATQKKLKAAVEQLENVAHKHSQVDKHKAEAISTNVELGEGECMIYVHVYHASGGRLDNWLSLVRLVGSSCASRPIYRHEKEVKALLDKRGSPESEGYLALKILASDILQVPDERAMSDAMGHTLLALKPGALRADRVCYFSHGRYGFYHYLNDALVMAD